MQGVVVTDAPRADGRDLGLETLPDEVLEKVLVFAIQVSGGGRNAQGRHLLRALPVVCKKLLAALRRLKMPLGHVKGVGNAEAVRQANEPGRAWGVGTCTLEG